MTDDFPQAYRDGWDDGWDMAAKMTRTYARAALQELGIPDEDFPRPRPMDYVIKTLQTLASERLWDKRWATGRKVTSQDVTLSRQVGIRDWNAR